MSAVSRFEDIQAWRAARELTRMVYDVASTGGFARDRRLRDQITGAAVSVMANIAEGFGSDTNAQFAAFLGYARRSVTEVQSLLYVTLDQQYISQDQFDAIYEQANKTASLVGGFVRYLRTRPDPRRDRMASQR
jgi:four helix bundle protein